MKPSHFLLLLFLNCGWAALPTIATRLEQQLEAREFVFLRYALALGAVGVLWPWLPGRLPRGGDFWRTVLMGIAVFNVGHLLQVAGIQGSRAGDASLLLAIDPLVSSLGAAIFLHERIPGKRWLGFGLAIGGVTAMSLWGRQSPLPGLLANLLVVLSFVTEAVWSVMGKSLIGRWGIPKVTGLALAAGTCANAALLVPRAGDHLGAFSRLGFEGWISLALLGVVFTAFGYSAWYLVIREAPVSLASMTIYLQPVLGTAFAVAFAGESLGVAHLVGSLMICAGVVVGIAGGIRVSPEAVPEK